LDVWISFVCVPHDPTTLFYVPVPLLRVTLGSALLPATTCRATPHAHYHLTDTDAARPLLGWPHCTFLPASLPHQFGFCMGARGLLAPSHPCTATNTVHLPLLPLFTCWFLPDFPALFPVSHCFSSFPLTTHFVWTHRCPSSLLLFPLACCCLYIHLQCRIVLPSLLPPSTLCHTFAWGDATTGLKELPRITFVVPLFASLRCC